MSFSIKLQRNNSDKHDLDKSITDISTHTGQLKDSSSIIDPVILIEANISNLSNCNYMTISEFGRKYFITDIVSVYNGLVEVHGHVDVLTTYKSQIRNRQAIISRQQKNYNLYVDDGVFKTYQNPNILTKSFPSGFGGTFEFVLAVAG